MAIVAQGDLSLLNMTQTVLSRGQTIPKPKVFPKQLPQEKTNPGVPLPELESD